MNAEDRARLFRLAWDFVGSALASRNELYERFYLALGRAKLSVGTGARAQGTGATAGGRITRAESAILAATRNRKENNRIAAIGCEFPRK